MTTGQEHNLSINGGNEKMNYFMSANYLTEDGTLNWNLDGLKRLNLFGKMEVKPYKVFTTDYYSIFYR